MIMKSSMSKGAGVKADCGGHPAWIYQDCAFRGLVLVPKEKLATYSYEKN